MQLNNTEPSGLMAAGSSQTSVVDGQGMSDAVRRHDWSATPLGHERDWPDALRSTIALCLASPLICAVHWGKALTTICNDAYAQALGEKHPLDLGRPMSEIWNEAWEGLGPQIDAALANGRGFSVQNQYRRMIRGVGSQDTWWTYAFAPVQDIDGKFSGVFVTAIETTSTVLADRAVRAERDRTRAVLDGMVEGFALLDRDFRVVDLNAEALRLETRTRQQMVGRTHWELYPGTEGSEIGNQYRRAMTERVPVTLEHLYRWEDGRSSWLAMRAYPVEEGIAIFFRDVSARHDTELSLRTSELALSVSEESLRLATDAAEVGTWDVDLAAGVMTWSARTKAMFGVSANVPCSMDDFYAGLHPDDLLHTRSAFAMALDPELRDTYDVEYRTVGKEDGIVRWVAAKGKGIFDATGQCVRAIGTAIDISSRKRAEMRRLAVAELSEQIRRTTDPDELGFVAARILGQTLNLSRAGYGMVDAAEESIVIARDWTAPGVQSVAGVLHFRDFGSYIDDLKMGRAVVIPDVRQDLRTQTTAADLEAINARALVNVPLHEQQGLVVLLFLTDAGVRQWSEDEMLFVREVAERTRTAAARLIAERELRASEKKFEVIANSIDQMVWATRPDGFHDYYNERWYGFTGAAPGSTHGTEWSSLIHVEDQARAWHTWRHSLTTGEAYRIEYRVRHHSGSYRWVLARAQAVRDAVGNITRWFGTCTDIQEIIDARDVLVRSRENLEQMVEERTAERDRLWKLVPDLVAIGRLDGTLRSVNPAWSDVLGFDEATLLAKPLWDLIHPDYLHENLAAIQEMKAGRTARYQNRIRTTSGAYRWFDWLSAPVGDTFYAVARDITDVKERDAELSVAQEALRQSQKMEAVGQLTGGIAHDFNNMLAVVIGSLDLLKRRLGSDDARAKRYIDSANDGARRAATLTQRLLAFSRQQPLQPELVDANKLVGGMAELIRGSIGADIRLEVVLAGGSWRTHVDLNQLENVLLNLAVNARDAMPEGGRLTIETQNAHLDGRYAAEHPGVPAGQYVLMAVTDTGSGMPPEVIQKAFDPFFTTKAVGKGTGLGLSQVYGFVKQSGGHVKIYSELGVGTTIKVYLPRLLVELAEESVGERVIDVPMGDSREVILVVEDEPGVRQFSVDALSDLGYLVLEADGAAAALQLLKTHPEISLLFTDVVMPDMDGRKLADAARPLRPDLKILFTTGYTRNAVVHNGVLDAGVELIGKPFTVDELASKVREVLDNS